MARFFYASNTEIVFLQRNRMMRKFRLDLIEVSEALWFAPYNKETTERMSILYQPQNEDQIFFTRLDIPQKYWVMQVYLK